MHNMIVYRRIKLTFKMCVQSTINVNIYEFNKYINCGPLNKGL